LVSKCIDGNGTFCHEFSEWDRIFKDPMTTAAAIDRLVHHSTVLELDCESYRAEQAMQRQKASK